MQDSCVGRGILQQGKVQTRHIDIAGAFIIDHIRIHIIEDDGLSQLTGTEQIEFSAAHQTGIGQFVAVGGVVNQHLEATILADDEGLYIEVGVNDHFFAILKVIDHFNDGFALFSPYIRVIQVILIGVNLVHGFYYYGHLFVSFPGDIFQHHLQMDIAIGSIFHLRYVGAAAASLQFHRSRQYREVDGYCLFIPQRRIGIYAIVGSKTLFFVLTNSTQVIVHGISTVCGHVLLIIGIGKGDSLRNEIKYRRCQVVPVTKGHLVRRDGLSFQSSIYSISSNGGRFFVIHSKQRSAVVIAFILSAVIDHRILDHVGVFVQAVRHLIDGIILKTQCGIVHHTHLYVVDVVTGGRNGVADVDHAVKRRGLIQQCQSLFYSQIPDAPGGNDSVALPGQNYVPGREAQESVLASENILFHGTVFTGHLE